MSTWIYALFMTWGMFLAIPCPLKIWDEAARPKMMACLPVIGLVPGGIWAFTAWVLLRLSCPLPLQGAVLAMIPWLVTGFLHLDGYMDVCDAVLSRRDLETRRKILKDSHCGAFAVICMCLLALTAWSVGQCRSSFSPLALLLVPVASRSCAALAVLLLKPLGSSQYAAMQRPKAGMLLWLALCGAAACGLGTLSGSFAPLGAVLGYGLGCRFGYKNLEGMSGDISGFALTVGELVGFAVAGLVG